MANLEQHHELTSNLQVIEDNEQLESSPINVQKSTTEDKRGYLKKAHPQGIRCEGCGHTVDFSVDYDHMICYRVPLLEGDDDRVFYFHDTFCVTLRRLKESIRHHVLDQSLPESRRTEPGNTMGYIQNLLRKWKTLITTKGKLPRPNPGIAADDRRANMRFLRANVHKLILREDALSGRKAPGFEEEFTWKFAEIPMSIQYA